MPNIIFYLNTGKEVKVSQEDFDKLELSKTLADQTIQYIDMGIRGFQKFSLTSWGPEELAETEAPVQ